MNKCVARIGRDANRSRWRIDEWEATDRGNELS
jgi:hypothetical protein